MVTGTTLFNCISKQNLDFATVLFRFDMQNIEILEVLWKIPLNNYNSLWLNENKLCVSLIRTKVLITCAQLKLLFILFPTTIIEEF